MKTNSSQKAQRLHFWSPTGIYTIFLQICKISCDTEATDVKQYYQECVCSKENTLLIVFSKENLQADVSTACSRWIVGTVCNVKCTALQYVAV